MNNQYLCAVKALANRPLAVLPSRLEALLEQLKTGAVDARSHSPASNRAGSDAVIPLTGFLDQHPGWLLQALGGTSTDQFASTIDQASRNKSIGRIIINADSPGGTIGGVQAAAAAVRRAAERKPVVAIANSLMASAAYWICSQATHLFGSPGAEIGSIGIVCIHHDFSEAEQAAGIRTTIIREPPDKSAGNPHERLSDAARANVEERIRIHYWDFVGDVANGRNTSTATVRDHFGGGMCLLTPQAIDVGMADGQLTLSELLVTDTPRRRRMAASASTIADDSLDLYRRRCRLAEMG